MLYKLDICYRWPLLLLASHGWPLAFSNNFSSPSRLPQNKSNHIVLLAPIVFY